MDISQQQQTINNPPLSLKNNSKKEHRGPRQNNPLTIQTRI